MKFKKPLDLPYLNYALSDVTARFSLLQDYDFVYCLAPLGGCLKPTA
jgi:hypothetical protein